MIWLCYCNLFHTRLKSGIWQIYRCSMESVVRVRPGVRALLLTICNAWCGIPRMIRVASQGSTDQWCRHEMETFLALLAIWAGNSPITGEFPKQRPVTRSFDVFFVLQLNKRSSKQSWGCWFETPSRPLWRHCNAILWKSNNVENIAHWIYPETLFQCLSLNTTHKIINDPHIYVLLFIVSNSCRLRNFQTLINYVSLG